MRAVYSSENFSHLKLRTKHPATKQKQLWAHFDLPDEDSYDDRVEHRNAAVMFVRSGGGFRCVRSRFCLDFGNLVWTFVASVCSTWAARSIKTKFHLLTSIPFYSHLHPEQEGPGAHSPKADGLSHSLKETQILLEHFIWSGSYTELAQEIWMRGPSVFASIYTNLQGSGSVACWLRRRWSLQCSSLQFQLRALPVSAIEQSPCQ